MRVTRFSDWLIPSVYSSSKRICRAGAGQEQTKDKCDTPGYTLTDDPYIKYDHRRSQKLYQPRNHPRINQTSMDLLQSWRGNCDVQILVYDSDPHNVDVTEISRVTDYVVAYATKGNCSLREEREQNRKLILASEAYSGDRSDVKRVCKQVMNKAASKRIISKQEAMVLLANLDLTGCSETVENVSISQSTKLQSKADRSVYVDGKFITQYQHRDVKYHGMSLCQYFEHVKNSKRTRSRKHIIPHFIGVQGYPCFPVSESYARHVLIVHKPWHGKYPSGRQWIKEFHQFIHSPHSPIQAKLTYERVMQRHYSKTTFCEPTTHKPDHSKNPISDQDLQDLLLVGLNAPDEQEHDVAMLKKIDRGLDYKWSKQPMVRARQRTETRVTRFSGLTYSFFAETELVRPRDQSRRLVGREGQGIRRIPRSHITDPQAFERSGLHRRRVVP